MKRIHGETKWINGRRTTSPEYSSWQMMRNRCLNPRAMDWKYYGGRGVRICKRWDKFENFLVDMGRRPTPLHTLDKKNNNWLLYCKRNCRWATRKEQSRNRDYVKLSTAIAAEIRRLYAGSGGRWGGTVRQVDLAKQFGTTQAHISQIVRGVSWRGMEAAT